MLENDHLHKVPLERNVFDEREVVARRPHECGGEHHRQIVGRHLVEATCLIHSGGGRGVGGKRGENYTHSALILYTQRVYTAEAETQPRYQPR